MPMCEECVGLRGCAHEDYCTITGRTVDPYDDSCHRFTPPVHEPSASAKALAEEAAIEDALSLVREDAPEIRDDDPGSW